VEDGSIKIVRQDELQLGMAGDGYDIRQPVTVGGLSVHFARIQKGSTRKGLYVGLPHDMCPCAHWTYVIRGRALVRSHTGEEAEVKAGDLCYSPPGHTWDILEDIEFVECSSPSFGPVLDHLRQELRRQTGGSASLPGTL
jgi:hypothetical protein